MKKIILLIVSLIFLLISTIGIASAYSKATIEHRYIVKSVVPTISYSYNNNKLSVTSSTVSNDSELVGATVVSTVDIITSSNSFDSSADISKEVSNNVYHNVYKNVDINNITLDGVTNGIIDVLINTYIFEDHNVTFNNNYVYDLNDLYLINSSKKYNNKYYFVDDNIVLGNKYIKSNNIFILDDLTIDDEFILNIPSSIYCYDNSITLNSDFNVRHLYSGLYYFDCENVVTTDKHINIETPNATYLLSDSENSYWSNNSNSFDDRYYLDNSLEFVENYIPDILFDNIMLPSRYQMSNCNYNYEISYDNGESFEEFNSAVINRTLDNQNVKIKVTSKIEDNMDSIIIDTIIAGTSDQSFVNLIKTKINNLDINGNSKRYEIGGILNYILKGYNTNRTFILDIDDGSDINYLINQKENQLALEYQMKLVLDDNKFNHLEFEYSDGSLKYNSETITDLYIDLGSIIVMDKLNLTISCQDVLNNDSIVISDINKLETIDYLKGIASAFITNQAYYVYRLGDDGIYLNDRRVTKGTLGLESIETVFKKHNDQDEYEDYDAIQYFNVKKDEDKVISYELTNGQYTSLLNDVILRYIFDGQYSFDLECIKGQPVSTIQGQLESNNPFAKISTKDDWLKSLDFTIDEVSSDYSPYYTKIEVTELNGQSVNFENGIITDNITLSEMIKNVDYNYRLDKIISIIPSNLSPQGDGYSLNVRININEDYIPYDDTTITLHCTCGTYNDNNEINIKTTQDITITIPGIFKCGDNNTLGPDCTPYEFDDINFYNMIKQIVGDEYVQSSENEEYLLASSRYLGRAEDDIDTFDFSGCTYSGDELSLTGIHYFEYISTMNFNNKKIRDISDFSYYDSHYLKKLYLSNCDLDDDVLGSNIYNILLDELDLSNNEITLTNDNVIFRTVKKLNLANQKDRCLHNIDLLKELVYLSELDISGNQIYRFEILKKLPLEILKVYDNPVDYYYGSAGVLNYPIYVWLIKENKTMIYQENDVDYLELYDDDGLLTTDITNACVKLNAFASPTKLYNTSQVNYIEQLASNGVASTGVKFYFHNVGNDHDDFVNNMVLKTFNLDGNKKSYVLVVLDSTENIIAYREFIVEVLY